MGGGMPSLPSMGGLPLGALSGLSNLGGLVKQVGAPGGAGMAAGGPGGGSAQVVGGSVIDQSIAKMMGFLGEPYSWGGGGANGPSKGTGVDANLVGFDCSGLTQYGAAQEGIQIPRHTYAQMKMGVEVPLSQIQKGDYVFSNFSGPGQPEHVARAISPTQVIEAPDRGGHVQISALPAGKIVVKRISAAQ
ncbi:NlpC/P60 family protein [Mycobacteroides abscessus]|nr:NlpC/P60 family protein [Mycobacteroides abscessus]